MPASTPPFTHLGRYRVVRELGRGAMGIVYLAEDDQLQRQVAVKTLLLPDDPNERKHLEARFRQEAKAAGGLNHPGIITIHDIGREGDFLYIAMELLQGTELRDRLAQGPLPVDEALDIGVQVGAALAAAHARGVVHRDIKPGNIMLLAGGVAKIMDFGIARMQTSEVRTQSGTMMGSPKYMSPEQVTGHTVDHRGDIFAMGTMLYEMVAGVPAFSGDNLGQLLNAIMHGTPPAPSQFRVGVPEALDAVLARAMQKNPAMRYQDAGEMARDLAQCRATITGSLGPAVPIVVPAPADPYAQTVVGSEAPTLIPLPPATSGLSLSRQFDSTAGLQRLLEGATDGPGPAARKEATGLRWMAWSLAYLAAGVGALAIALV